MTNQILELVKSLLHSAFDSFDAMALQACQALTGSTVNTMWTRVAIYSGAFKPFCNVIIGICMLIELAKTFSKVDVLTWEQGLKVGVKVVLAKVCIEQAPTFLKACYNQATAFITYLSRYGGDVSISNICGDKIDTYIGSVSGLGSALGLLVSVILLQMGIKICGVIIVVMAYGRMFEILIYLMISPVPCAFLPLGEGDNLSRIPMRFFKSFIAVCLQGVMMFMSIRLFGTIISTAFRAKVAQTIATGVSSSTMVADLCYDMILFTIVLVMAVTKSSSWAKSIIDAG